MGEPRHRAPGGGRRREIRFQEVSGHTLVGYQHAVTLEVGGWKFQAIPILFSRGVLDNAANILGQQNLFGICPIKFVYRLKEIDIMLGSSKHCRSLASGSVTLVTSLQEFLPFAPRTVLPCDRV